MATFKHPGKSSRKHNHPLHLEPLERRQLLSVAAAINPAWTITTANSDHIAVLYNSASRAFDCYVNNVVAQSRPAASVKKLIINGGAGSDITFGGNGNYALYQLVINRQDLPVVPLNIAYAGDTSTDASSGSPTQNTTSDSGASTDPVVTGPVQGGLTINNGSTTTAGILHLGTSGTLSLATGTIISNFGSSGINQGALVFNQGSSITNLGSGFGTLNLSTLTLGTLTNTSPTIGYLSFTGTTPTTGNLILTTSTGNSTLGISPLGNQTIVNTGGSTLVLSQTALTGATASLDSANLLSLTLASGSQLALTLSADQAAQFNQLGIGPITGITITNPILLGTTLHGNAQLTFAPAASS